MKKILAKYGIIESKKEWELFKQECIDKNIVPPLDVEIDNFIFPIWVEYKNNAYDYSPNGYYDIVTDEKRKKYLTQFV